MIDGTAENVAMMTDKKLLNEWLAETVKVAGMTPFGAPFSWGFPWPGSSDWTALTGFQPLMESHCSVHCWPERKYIFADLFSCSRFDDKRVEAYIIRAFKMVKPSVMLLERGLSKKGELMPARLL